MQEGIEFLTEDIQRIANNELKIFLENIQSLSLDEKSSLDDYYKIISEEANKLLFTIKKAVYLKRLSGINDLTPEDVTKLKEYSDALINKQHTLIPPDLSSTLFELSERYKLNDFTEEFLQKIYDALFAVNKSEELKQAETKDMLSLIYNYFDNHYETDKKNHIDIWIKEIWQEEIEKGQMPQEEQFNSKKIFEAAINKKKESIYQGLLLVPKACRPEIVNKREDLSIKKHLKHLFDSEENNYPYVFYYKQLVKEFQNQESPTLVAWMKVREAYEKLGDDIAAQVNLLLAMESFNDIFNKLSFIKYDKNYPLIDAFNTYMLNNDLHLSLQGKENILQNMLKYSNLTNDKFKDFVQPLLDKLTVEVVSRLWKEEESLAKTFEEKQSSLHGIIYKYLNLLQGFDNFPRLAFKEKNERNLKPNGRFISNELSELPLLVPYLLDNSKREVLQKAKPYIIAEMQVQKTLTQLKNKAIKPNSTALSDLKQLKSAGMAEANRADISQRDRNAQAAYKYQISKKKYTISDEEIALIAKITGINVTKLVLMKKENKVYPNTCLTHSELMQTISSEISERRRQNSTGYRKYLGFIPGVKRPIKILEVTKDYVNYHAYKLSKLTQVEKRLNPPIDANNKQDEQKQGEHRSTLQSATLIRAHLTKGANSLSNFVGKNRNLKKLNELLTKKTELSQKLKQKATELTPSPEGKNKNEKLKSIIKQKNQRNQHIVDNIERSKDKKLFEPSLLMSKASLFEVPSQKLKIQKVINQFYYVEDLFVRLMENKDEAIQEASRLFFNKEWAVKYSSDFFKKLNDDDLPTLYKNLNNTVDTLDKNVLGFTQEDYQIYINQVGLAIDLAKSLKRKYLNMIYSIENNFLALDNFKIIIKMELNKASAKLIKGCELPQNFVINDKYALNMVGEKLKESKDNKKTLKERAMDYRLALKMQIEAKEEGRTKFFVITTTIQNNAERVKLLRKEADAYIYAISKYMDETRPIFGCNLVAAKLAEIAKDLRAAADELEKNTPPAEIVSIFNQEEEKLRSEMQREEIKIQELVNAAKETVDTFSYYADHTTTPFEGIRVGRN